MSKYLGETPVTDFTGTPYEGFTPTDWAMLFITKYGQISGEHHKAWVLDQVSRILKGTPVEVTLATWDTGEKEYRINTGTPSQSYLGWVSYMLGEYNEENEEYEYEYDEGNAP